MSAILNNIAISASIRVGISPNVSTLSGNMSVSDVSNLTTGVGSTAGNADGVYTASGTVVSGTPVSINLTALTDAFGNTLTTGHIVALKISNASASGAGTLSHGGGSDPIYAALPLAISPGDFFCQSFNAAGLAVVASSAQYLQLTASTGTVSYKVTAVVRSA